MPATLSNLPLPAGQPFGIVPPVISPLNIIGDGAVPQYEPGALGPAQELAAAEFRHLNVFLREFKYPKLKLWRRIGCTAKGWRQMVNFLTIANYNQHRELNEARDFCDFSAMGPLPLAVHRAVQRNTARGRSNPTPLLEIGAGLGGVAGGLKVLLGDWITIDEIAPRYPLWLGTDPIDMRYPPAVIEKAVLPADHYELVYSIYGSFYSDDQLAVLQNMMNTLRVGGEALSMWHGPKNQVLADLTNEHQPVFQDGGMDIFANSVLTDNSLRSSDYIRVVWARKRRENVDVRAMFREAGELKEPPKPPALRLSIDGPYFSGLLYAHEYLEGVIAEMIKEFSAYVRVDHDNADISTLYHKLADADVKRGEDENAVLKKFSKHILDKISDKLISGMPLTIALLYQLHQVFPVLQSNLTVQQRYVQEMMFFAKCLLK